VNPDQVLKFSRKLAESPKSTPPVMNQYYCSQFNTVDLHDQFWEKIQNKHAIHSWRACFVLAILYTGIINSWSLAVCQENCELQEFYDALAKFLLDPDLTPYFL